LNWQFGTGPDRRFTVDELDPFQVVFEEGVQSGESNGEGGAVGELDLHACLLEIVLGSTAIRCCGWWSGFRNAELSRKFNANHN
jgi:hypothetical protein